MAVVKRAVFLLLLLAVSTYADHHGNHTDQGNNTDHGNHTHDEDHQGDHKEHANHADCENLNKALQSKDLHKSFGDWVLVYGVSNQSENLGFLSNLSSSHIELRLLEDNKTVTHKEWNKYKDGSCTNYFIKTSLAENRADDEHHTLPIDGYHLETNRTVEWLNNTAKFQFYQSGDNSLLIVFDEGCGKFLLHYVREGHHSDVKQLRAHDDRLDRQAKCLKFSHEEKFLYEGAAEPCHKETPQAFIEHLEQRGQHVQHDHNGQEQ